jgi:hypothetical protein
MKHLLYLSVFIPALLSCTSPPHALRSAEPVPVQQVWTTQSVAESTASPTLDTAISAGVVYLSGRMPPKAKVAFVSVQSPTENLSNYIIDSAVMYLVNNDQFTVIERSELDALQKEQRYQASGEVSDETAVSIGHQLGAQVIITGAIMEMGDKYSLRLKALAVETAQILGTRIYQVKADQTLTALLKPPPQNAEVLTKTETPPEPPKQPVIQGDVNITTNNNTTINGDVYVNVPKNFGW